jgi:hypothetical protein
MVDACGRVVDAGGGLVDPGGTLTSAGHPHIEGPQLHTTVTTIARAANSLTSASSHPSGTP